MSRIVWFFTGFVLVWSIFGMVGCHSDETLPIDVNTQIDPPEIDPQADPTPDPNPNPTPEPETFDHLCVDGVCPIEHCGEISASEVWGTERTHVVTCDVVLSGEDFPMLEIRNGAKVYFLPGTKLSVTSGELTTCESDQINPETHFTSARAVPTAGDWIGINVENSAGARLCDTKIEYASVALRNRSQVGINLESVVFDQNSGIDYFIEGLPGQSLFSLLFTGRHIHSIVGNTSIPKLFVQQPQLTFMVGGDVGELTTDSGAYIELNQTQVTKVVARGGTTALIDAQPLEISEEGGLITDRSFFWED